LAIKNFDYDGADKRLAQEMGRAASQYDQARADLAAHHGKMSEEETQLVAKLSRIEPYVDKAIRREGKLNRGSARAMLDYMRTHARLQRVRQAKRMAYGATDKPGAQPMGGAIGDKSSEL
jgi:hypothetical protein